MALAPGVAQRLGGLSQVTALLGLEEPEHPDALEEVRVSMALFELLQSLGIFFDYPRVVYLRHALIMTSTKRNGMTTVSVILAAETYRGDIHEDQPQERRLIAESHGGSTATE